MAAALASHTTSGTSTGVARASGSVWAYAPSNKVAPTGTATSSTGAARTRCRMLSVTRTAPRSAATARSPASTPVAANTATRTAASGPPPRRIPSRPPSAAAPSACATIAQAVLGRATISVPLSGRVTARSRGTRYLVGGYFCSLRCRLRRWMPSRRAASEMFPPASESTRLMCSHSARASDGAL